MPASSPAVAGASTPAPRDRILDAVAPQLRERGVRASGQVLGRGTYGIVYQGAAGDARDAKDARERERERERERAKAGAGVGAGAGTGAGAGAGAAGSGSGSGAAAVSAASTASADERSTLVAVKCLHSFSHGHYYQTEASLQAGCSARTSARARTCA